MCKASGASGKRLSGGEGLICLVPQDLEIALEAGFPVLCTKGFFLSPLPDKEEKLEDLGYTFKVDGGITALCNVLAN